MNTEKPHEILRFTDGETVPLGYMPLTEDEHQLLEPMTVDERAEWLRHNGRRGGFEELRDALHSTKDDDSDLLRRRAIGRPSRAVEDRAREQRGKRRDHGTPWAKNAKRPGGGRR